MALLRREIEPFIHELARKYPVVTITGPRQSGKTTLAKMLFPDKPYVNFERPDNRERFTEDPKRFLAGFPSGAVLDEVQRVPDLLSWIQAQVDEEPGPGRYILTGSTQFELLERVGQSLAGRTGLARLLPFSLSELSAAARDEKVDFWLHEGFYPRIHDQELDPSQAYGDYVQTYLERDVRQLSEIRNLAAFQRFVRLCAGRTGQLLNLEALGADAGISGVQARHWLSLLEASFLVCLLPPWFENIGKRLVKSPKLYFLDVGLASWLCGIESRSQLATHPLRGNLFESMVVVEALKRRFNAGRVAGLHFFRDARGLEVDLLWPQGATFVPIEIKSGETVHGDFLANLRALAELLPDRCRPGVLVHAGTERGIRQGVAIRGFADFTDALGLAD